MDAGIPADAIAAARDAVKVHLRAAGTSEDALIAQHAASAMGLCEAFTGQVLIVRALRQTLAARGAWQRLDHAPVRAITGVAWIAQDGVATPVSAEGHAIDIDARGEGWIRMTGAGEARIAVDYQAGLATDWAGLPPPVAQGVVLLAAHLFEAKGAQPPAVVTALWRPWRRMRLSGERAA